MVSIVIETNIDDFPTIYAYGITCSANGVFVSDGEQEKYILASDIKSITIKKEGEK